MRTNTLTVTDLIHRYEPEIGDSKATRIAKLLRFVESKLPGTYIPRRFVAKVAFALNKVPGEKSEDVGKRLTCLISSAEKVLRKESGDYIEKHRFLGVRIINSSPARLHGPLMDKRKRAEGLITSIQEISGFIKPEELSAEDKKEFAKYRKFNPLLEQFRKEVPLLEAPKVVEDDKKDDKKKK